MAYIVQRDEDKQKAAQAAATGAPAASPFAALSEPGAPTPAGAKPAAPQGSGQFMDPSRYLAANAGAGQRLAGALAGQAQRAVGTARQQLSGTVDRFNNQAAVSEPERPPGDFVATNTPREAAREFQTLDTDIRLRNNQLNRDAGSELARYAQSLKDYEYSGPGNLSGQDYDTALQSAIDARSRAQALQTDAGRQALLGSRGNAFDALLAGQAGRNQFNDVANRAGQLDQLFSGAQTAAQQRIAEQQRTAEAIRQRGNDYLTQANSAIAQADADRLAILDEEPAARKVYNEATFANEDPNKADATYAQFRSLTPAQQAFNLTATLADRQHGGFARWEQNWLRTHNPDGSPRGTANSSEK